MMPGLTTSICLADDDADDCLFFQEALTKLSSRVQLTIASDGEELMNLLKRDTVVLPDLIFLDLNMPKKNGFECLAEIRSSNLLQNIPVILFSTSNEAVFIKKGQELGADHYICKPSSYLQLKNVLEKILLAGNVGDFLLTGE